MTLVMTLDMTIYTYTEKIFHIYFIYKIYPYMYIHLNTFMQKKLLFFDNIVSQ